MRRVRIALFLVALSVGGTAAAANAQTLTTFPQRFAYTDLFTCVQAPAPGIEPETLQLLAPGFQVSGTAQGTFTMNADGSGTDVGREVAVVDGATSVGAAPVAEAQYTCLFTSVTNPDGSFTSSVFCNFTQTRGLGVGTPFATYTVTGIKKTGQTGTGLSSTTIPSVETLTFSNGIVHSLICARSNISVLIPVPQ